MFDNNLFIGLYELMWYFESQFGINMFYLPDTILVELVWKLHDLFFANFGLIGETQLLRLQIVCLVIVLLIYQTETVSIFNILDLLLWFWIGNIDNSEDRPSTVLYIDGSTDRLKV